MTSPATTDLCDAHPEIQVCEPLFQMFGGNVRFSGPITTLKVFAVSYTHLTLPTKA